LSRENLKFKVKVKVKVYTGVQYVAINFRLYLHFIKIPKLAIVKN